MATNKDDNRYQHVSLYCSQAMTVTTTITNMTPSSLHPPMPPSHHCHRTDHHKQVCYLSVLVAVLLLFKGTLLSEWCRGREVAPSARPKCGFCAQVGCSPKCRTAEPRPGFSTWVGPHPLCCSVSTTPAPHSHAGIYTVRAPTDMAPSAA